MDTGVLAVHYQNENCHPDGKIAIGMAADAQAWRQRTIAAATRLMAGARRLGIPLIHLRLAVKPDFSDVLANAPMFRQWLEQEAWKDGSWGARFLAELAPVADELQVTHIRNNVFHGSALQDALDDIGPTRLIVAGVSTALAVEGAVRHAADVGYVVSVAHDACQTASLEAHEAALRTMAMFAEVRSVDEILAELSPAD